MWTPKDLIGGIRRLFGSGPVPESVVRRYPTGDVFARATPETVRIVETYSYQQEISRNRNLQSDQSRPPTGHVEISLPYDGDHYFTRQAISDVAAQVPPDHSAPTDALVGHLVLDNHGDADFGQVGNRNGESVAIPIRVPVAGGGLPPGYDHLIDDRVSCVLTHDYRPDPDKPEIFPVTVSIELLDTDNPDFMEITGELDTDGATAILAKIRQSGTGRPSLELRVKVQVHVAGGSPNLLPEVALVSIGWRKMTSLSSFHLSVSRGPRPQIWYNPVTKSIEWRHVVLSVAGRKTKNEQVREGQDTAGHYDGAAPVQQNEPQEQDEPEPAIRTYESPIMSLFVEQPGELYQEPTLQARVDVRIPQLLSGMDARLYGGTGGRTMACQPELTSVVSTWVDVILDDAFAERTVAASQHLHFGEVLLDEGRLDDIRNALAGHGFESLFDRRLGADPYEHLLVHRRNLGPDTMELWYLVEGRRFTIDREKVVAGETLTTPVESGDMTIHAIGTLRTSSREVTRAMNALQQVLRSPFAHVRVRR